VLLTERSGAGTSGDAVKEDRTPGEEGPKSRFFGLGLRKEDRKGHVFGEHKGSTGGEQPSALATSRPGKTLEGTITS